MNLVVCETVAAITTHLREVSDEYPIKLGGHSNKPKALCGREINWDTRLPISSARCTKCLAASIPIDHRPCPDDDLEHQRHHEWYGTRCPKEAK